VNGNAFWRDGAAAQVSGKDMDVVAAARQLTRLAPGNIARPTSVGREGGGDVGNTQTAGRRQDALVIGRTSHAAQRCRMGRRLQRHNR
jgi:hypothetical protein